MRDTETQLLERLQRAANWQAMLDAAGTWRDGSQELTPRQRASREREAQRQQVTAAETALFDLLKGRKP